MKEREARALLPVSPKARLSFDAAATPLTIFFQRDRLIHFPDEQARSQPMTVTTPKMAR